MVERPKQIVRGIPLSPGYGIGRAVRVTGGRREIPRIRIRQGEVDPELRRFATAMASARDAVDRARLRVRADLGVAEAEIFSAHRAMLDDPTFSAHVEERVRRDLINAERAVEDEVADLADRLAGAPDAYIRERAIDVKDIGRRVLASLQPHQPESIVPLSDQSVVVATELLPAETVDLDRTHVNAIVTEFGGETSHVAILARALGIPAVSGIRDALERIDEDTFVLVDGQNGELVLDPSEEIIKEFEERKSDYDQATRIAFTHSSADCRTRDGTRISLQANMGRVEEAVAVAQHGLDQVGLFRTEFLFLDSREPPAFERQVGIYRRVLRELGGRPLTVRTLDLGGDKVPTFLPPYLQRNPTLGLRGLRFSLVEDRLFDTQLRALASAAHDGPLRVLFPMVMDGEDVAAAVDRLRFHEKAAGASRIQVGAMIETPAAVFSIEEVSQQVDFLTVGTNDLAQFILAADRDAVGLVGGSSFEHPSVLRALAQVVAAAHETGRPLSVCGEAAGDPRSACILVGLGFRELSMSPVRALSVRRALNNTSVDEAATLARAATEAVGPRRLAERLSVLFSSERS